MNIPYTCKVCLQYECENVSQDHCFQYRYMNMSAGDEDTELRDLVTQTLENNGLLGKIQAQLRAGVFLALEDTDKKVIFNMGFLCINYFFA